MKWKKLGRVYVARGEYDWAQTHAYMPTSMLLDGERIRIYCAFLDKQQVGRLGFVDVEARNPLKVLGVSRKPVLDIGELGTFDDSGVTPMSIVDYKQKNLCITRDGKGELEFAIICLPGWRLVRMGAKPSRDIQRCQYWTGVTMNSL